MLRNTLSFARLLGRFKRCESGQLAVIFGLASLPVALAVGAAIDYSRGNQVRSNLQNALDSAVLAAAIDGSSNWQTTALNAFNANFTSKIPSTVGTPQFDLSNSIYSGSVSAAAQTAFMGVGGIKTINISARSASTTGKAPICILALNAFDKGAFDQNGNSTLNAPDCAVQANTVDGKGMTQEGTPTAIARQFGVSGGHTGTTYSTTPRDNSAAVTDPYASMPFPAYDACGNNPKGIDINGGTTTLNPGTYCGGVRIKGGASVTLNPGIYVMVDGAFWIDGASSVTGQEVMIAFTGTDATLRLWGNSTLNLTSPTSGTYANFQFFQNPNDAKGRGAWVSIGGNGKTDDASKASWDGVAYFPTQNFWVFGNTVLNINSPNMALVAGQVWIQGNATLNVTHNNPRNLNVAQVMMNSGARLVR